MELRWREYGTFPAAIDPEGGARVLEVLNSLNSRRPPVDGVPDTRSQARRDADALVEAMSSLLDEGELPSRGGQRPHLVLTMRLSDLVTGLGTVTLDTGGCLTAAETRRLACDAMLVPMVLGSDSMPLDVGRQHRLATAAIDHTVRVWGSVIGWGCGTAPGEFHFALPLARAAAEHWALYCSCGLKLQRVLIALLRASAPCSSRPKCIELCGCARSFIARMQNYFLGGWRCVLRKRYEPIETSRVGPQI